MIKKYYVNKSHLRKRDYYTQETDIEVIKLSDLNEWRDKKIKELEDEIQKRNNRDYFDFIETRNLPYFEQEFICKECGFNTPSRTVIVRHLNKEHNIIQDTRELQAQIKILREVE